MRSTLLNLVSKIAYHSSERDSPRDQFVVTLFLIIVFGLLVGAAVKGRIENSIE